MKHRITRRSPWSYLLVVPVFVFGLASILATDVPTDATGGSGSSANYLYANWNCNHQSQCIAVIGNNTGSAGPFCTKAPCDDWRNTYFFGATCDAKRKYPLRAQGKQPCQD